MRTRSRKYSLRGLMALLLAVACDAPGSERPAAAADSAGALTPAAQNDSGGETIWEGSSGGLRMRWTTDDLQVGAAQGSMVSLADALRAAFERDMAVRDAGVAAENPCTRVIRITLLSVVGPLVSVREATTTTCEREAHPAGETRFATLDFSSGRSPPMTPGDTSTADLRAFFADSAILSALRNDAYVRQALESGGVSPGSLRELLDALAASPPVLDDTRCFAFPTDLPSRFAFDAVEGDSVAVRLGLPGAGPCRENLTPVRVLLPLPPALAGALAAADARAEGFLMKDAEAIARERVTVLTFRTPP